MTATRRALVCGAATVESGAADAQHGHSASGQTGAERSGFAAEMHQAMRAMAAAMDSAPITGDPDRDFLAMMIPHHQGAVDMARVVLVHGRDPLTRQLAEEIIASQRAEIASMQARLDVLSTGGAAADRFPALSGTRGE